MLPFGHDDARERALPWEELRDMAVAADQGGLDSVWGADHLVFRSDGEWHGIHEAWTLLTAVAAVTSRVTIGPLVLALPFRNPALLAKMAVALDEVSNGRLVLGVGCGWHEPEFTAFDYPFDNRVGRFEEALQVLLPLLREGRVTFQGRWHRADTPLLPRGPRPNGPPVLIAGKGPRMLRLVARHADSWNAAWYGMPADADELRERVRRLHDACAAEGRDPATLPLTAGIFVTFPALMTDGDEQPPDNAIAGDVDHVARALAGYAEMGMDEVIVHLWPRTAAAVTQLGRAAELSRSPSALAAG